MLFIVCYIILINKSTVDFCSSPEEWCRIFKRILW